MSGNIVTAATVTDGEAIMSGNIITAATVTDGEATDWKYYHCCYSTDGQATMSENTLLLLL